MAAAKPLPRWLHGVCLASASLLHTTARATPPKLQRGAGTDQPIMRTVAAEVARGRWVHIFPEGKASWWERGACGA